MPDDIALRIILLRHAKSSWTEAGLGDHARPLSVRGREDAPRVAAELVRRGWVPDFIASSDSTRTVETWDRIRGFFPEADALITRRLYHAGADQIVQLARELPPFARTVMFIGHNSGWEQAVEIFSGVFERMTTANAALLTTSRRTWIEAFQVRDARAGTPHAEYWKLVSIVRPRELT